MITDKSYSCICAYFEGRTSVLPEAKQLIHKLSLPPFFSHVSIAASNLRLPDLALENWITFERLTHEGISGCFEIVGAHTSLYFDTLKNKRPGWSDLVSELMKYSPRGMSPAKAADVGRQDALETLSDEIRSLRGEIYENDDEIHQSLLDDTDSVNHILREVDGIRYLAVSCVCDTALEVLEAFEAQKDPNIIAEAHHAWAVGYQARRYDDIFRAEKIRDYLSSPKALTSA
jgi:hypothetical protein